MLTFKYVRLGLMSLLACFSFSASAEYLMIVGSDAAVPSDAKTISGNGTSSRKGISLSDALRALTPPDWKAYGSPDIDGGMRVEPEANVGWQEALSGLAKTHNFKMTANYEAKTLYIEPGAGGVKYLNDVEVPKEWTLQTNMTLSENLQDWAKKINWTISWGLGDDDFEIDAETTFQGDIATALKAVADAYRSSERPFSIMATSNNVFRVEPLSH